MAQWNLSEIRTKARQVSGRLSVSELSNAQIDEYINKYFQFEFPAEVKLNRNLTLHEFNTTANVQEYDFPADYTNFVPAATLDRREISFYQSPDDYDLSNPENVSRFTTWTGDGLTVSFASTYTNNIPIIPGSVVVDDTVEVFSDDGVGALTGNAGGSGTINYTTGAVSVTFNTAPISGQSIFSSFIQYQPGTPLAVLMFNNKFKFYPIPDRAYRFQIKAWSLLYVKPVTGAIKTTFTLATDKPLQEEWGPSIAYGAARRIASDFGEMDRYAELTTLYKEQINYILTRTHIDLESTRATPRF
tara:strand:- start:4252 stop:5157 length:906 start_codon:yes stop_codon:yes gene_type:complete